MEFRIAPLIMAVLNMIIILSANPNINDMIPLSSVSNIYKILIPFVVIFFMSIGAYSRHSYFSKTYKIAFYFIQCLNICLAIYYVYAIKSQHLG